MIRNFSCFILWLLLVSLCYKVSAQYFYKDAWNPRLLTHEMLILKDQKIKAVSIKSFENNGEPSEGFFCEKIINKNYTLAQTHTRSNVTSESLLSSYFNSKGLVVKTTDSTESSLYITEYQYDDSNRVIAVKTFAKANDNRNGIAEDRVYVYTAGGQPGKMIRKKNDTEISVVNFKSDDKGNIIEEEELFKTGKGTKYFYYYDDKNNLTDVVHYYERAKRLLPDYMYEYDAAGQIKQMITIEEGGGYFTWIYIYNEQGLRVTEKCFSKNKKLVGRVEYSYSN